MTKHQDNVAGPYNWTNTMWVESQWLFECRKRSTLLDQQQILALIQNGAYECMLANNL